MKTPVICMDCSPLLVRSAGVKTYLYHLVRGMRDLRPEAVRTFLAPRHLDLLDHDGGPMAHPAKLAALVALNRLPRMFCDVAIPRCDVFHISNLLRNPPARPRLTTTLHDLTPWIMPQSHKPSMVRAENEFAERILKRAAGIIAVSENTKQDAVRILKLPPEKIRVIHLGVPASYFSVTEESRNRVTAAYRLQRPYFLFVGTIEPRKNIDTLLTAWDGLPDSLRHEHELVLVGMPGWQAQATTDRILQENREGRIRYLGYVPENDLPALTAAAMGFVYPSLYEGFGIPVAQAMAAGCPVITSNVSSLPEITSGSALLIDPESVSELSAALQSVIERTDLRTRLRTLGIKTAAKYTWQRTAAESLDLLSSLAI